jgi:phage FluMu protein Com
MKGQGNRSMEREKIICIFCGAIANVKEQDNLIIVSCPRCKRETEVDEYQEIFNQWLGDIRNKDGER